MAELKIDGRMKVKTLKANFKKNFGSTLRVYKSVTCKGAMADDDATLASLRAEGAKGGELTVGAGCGLEGHAVHAGDLAEIAGGGLVHLAAALDGGRGRERVDGGEAGQSSHFLVDAGIVLHGAGAQGIEAAVHAVDPLAELGIVAGNVGFAELGQGKLGLALIGGVKLDLGHVARGQQTGLAAGYALLKNQLHASTSFPDVFTSFFSLLCFAVLSLFSGTAFLFILPLSLPLFFSSGNCE